MGIRPESLYADLCYPGLPGILYVPKQRKVKSTSANSVTANTANPHLTRLKCRFSNEPSLLLPRSVPLNEACRNNSHVRSANPSSLAYPSPLNQRRAFTMENPRRKLEKAPTQRNISNTDNPGRKASIKQRFSLIMSSFTGSPKSKSPSLTSMDPQDTATNPNPPVLTGEPLITGTPLNSANVEWPSQTLHTPKSVSILRPEISIILHRDFLESDGKENVLVALEVNAACGNKKTQEPLVVVSLDIVVIIDNSYATLSTTQRAI